MKISYLQEFLALSEYRNYSAAAEHLFISQPVLSRHIASLEAAVDTKLFYRDTKNVSLTKAGEIFRDRARTIVMTYETLCSDLQLLKEGYNTSLTIGVPYFALNDYLGTVPARFSAENPSVQLSYEVGSPNKILKALESETADMAILPHLNYPTYSDIIFEDLFDEKMGIIISSDDPLASSDMCSISELRDYTFFQIGGQYFSSTFSLLRNLCRHYGFEPSCKNTDLMESALVGARNGAGIIVAGEHMRHQAVNGLSYIPLDDKNAIRKIALCYKNSQSGNPNIKKFVSLYR